MSASLAGALRGFYIGVTAVRVSVEVEVCLFTSHR